MHAVKTLVPGTQKVLTLVHHITTLPTMKDRVIYVNKKKSLLLSPGTMVISIQNGKSNTIPNY